MLRLVFFAASAYPVGRMVSAATRLSFRAGMLPCLAFLFTAVLYWPCLWLELFFGPTRLTRMFHRFPKSWLCSWPSGRRKTI